MNHWDIKNSANNIEGILRQAMFEYRKLSD